MPIEILMPALSPTMEQGSLTKWLVKEGDIVASGDLLAEIETDKATMEFEAVDEGVIGKILIPEGSQDVAVNTPIAILLDEGETADGPDQPAPAPTSAVPPKQRPQATTNRPLRSKPPQQRHRQHLSGNRMRKLIASLQRLWPAASLRIRV